MLSTNIARNLLIVTVAAACFVLSIEISARVDDALSYGAPFDGNYAPTQLRRTVNGIPCNVPNSRFEKWSNNNLGFRGSDVSRLKPSGKLRVVCLGASESYGLHESSGKEWPAQLQCLLGIERYEVINASVVGLGLGDYKRYSIDRVLGVQPDIVVIVVNPFVYATSLLRSKSLNAKAEARLQSDVESSERNFSFRCLRKFKQGIKTWIVASFPSVYEQYESVRTKRQIEAIEKQRLNGRKALDDVPDFVIDKFRQDLRDTVRVYKQHNAKVVVCTYPVLVDGKNIAEYSNEFNDNRRFFVEFSRSALLKLPDIINSAAKKTAVEERATVADVSCSMEKSRKMFGDSVHYTDAGAKVFALKVVDAIKKLEK